MSKQSEEEKSNASETKPENQKTEREALAESVTAVLECGKALQETAGRYSGRLKTEGDALGEEAIALEKKIKELLKKVNAAAEKEEISSEVAEGLEVELYRARGMVYEGDVAALLPHKANGIGGQSNESDRWHLLSSLDFYGRFLGALLGHVNVRSARRDVRLKVKEEYNSYRDRTALLFLAFPVALLILKDILWEGCFPGLPVHAYQAWLLFFYTSLALRENILRVNGSDIRPWWIQHHYFAMLMALISLTWSIEGPDCASKQHGVSLFLTWAVMQGVAMLLQNRYQRQRLYTRIALGKAGRMDVVWGETAGMKGQLWLLYPLLFVLQMFQFYIGILLLYSTVYELFEWQIAACGTLLVMMAVGNFSNTVGTVVVKYRIKAKMRKQGHQMLERMSSQTKFKAKGA